MTGSNAIRLIDLGYTSAERTQAVFHAVAELMTIQTPDTIIICRPVSPYLSLGYHQVYETVLDRTACARLHLPVFRRRVGGGTTLLDSNQLFYQCIFHRSRVPAIFSAIFGLLLQAPVATLRRLGLAATLDQVNEITVDGKRIAGTGGGQIEEACVVVGNLLFDFDDATIAQAWRVPSELFRELALAAMREHITTLRKLSERIRVEDVHQILVEEFNRALKRPLELGKATQAESEHAQMLGVQLQSAEFLSLHDDGVRDETPPLKIAAGVFIHADEIEFESIRVRGSFRVHNGYIEEARLEPNEWSKFQMRLHGIPFKEWQSYFRRNA